MRVDAVPGWALVSAILSPLFMIGGWTLAASLQPGRFDQLEDTVSALAGFEATDPFVMTAGFVVCAVGLVFTGVGLKAAGVPGRVLLVVAGLALLGVSAFPLRAGGDDTVHGVFAGIEFAALALWPLLGARLSRTAPSALRLGVALPVTVVLSALVAWFVVALDRGGLKGLTERILIAAELIWPLIAVVSARRRR
jgi:hypothetical membrane protein